MFLSFLYLFIQSAKIYWACQYYVPLGIQNGGACLHRAYLLVGDVDDKHIYNKASLSIEFWKMINALKKWSGIQYLKGINHKLIGYKKSPWESDIWIDVYKEKKLKEQSRGQCS